MTDIARRPPAGASEWRRNWSLVLAAMIGVSFAMIPTLTLGLFMAPLQAEFGWNRTEISGGLTVFALVNLPLVPLVGLLVDRFGTRRIALPGLVLTSFAFAAFALMGGSLVQWFATWVVLTLVALAVNILVWTTAVSSAFSRSRGLAIALVLCGAALTQALAPIASRWLIDEFGWRPAYVVLGAGWGGLAFVLSLFLFHDRRAVAPQLAEGTAPAVAAGGLTVGAALRNVTLIRIAIGTFLHTTLATALLVHMIPLLTSIGLSRTKAASFALIFAVASLTGKLLTGWLVDRISAAWLPALCYGGQALSALLLLRASGSPVLLVVAIFVMGYCGGAALQLTAYLTTRYAGLRNFGTIYGFMSTLMALSAGLGPLIGGAVFDYAGNYSPLLAGGCVVGLLAGLVTLGLGHYPEFGAGPDQTFNP